MDNFIWRSKFPRRIHDCSWENKKMNSLKAAKIFCNEHFHLSGQMTDLFVFFPFLKKSPAFWIETCHGIGPFAALPPTTLSVKEDFIQEGIFAAKELRYRSQSFWNFMNLAELCWIYCLLTTFYSSWFNLRVFSWTRLNFEIRRVGISPSCGQKDKGQQNL